MAYATNPALSLPDGRSVFFTLPVELHEDILARHFQALDYGTGYPIRNLVDLPTSGYTGPPPQADLTISPFSVNKQMSAFAWRPFLENALFDAGSLNIWTLRMLSELPPDLTNKIRQLNVWLPDEDREDVPLTDFEANFDRLFQLLPRLQKLHLTISRLDIFGYQPPNSFSAIQPAKACELNLTYADFENVTWLNRLLLVHQAPRQQQGSRKTFELHLNLEGQAKQYDRKYQHNVKMAGLYVFIKGTQHAHGHPSPAEREAVEKRLEGEDLTFNERFKFLEMLQEAYGERKGVEGLREKLDLHLRNLNRFEEFRSETLGLLG